MTQYDTLNVKLSNLQPHKVKPGIKNDTGATLNHLSKMTGYSNDETNVWYKLLLTDTQVSRLHKSFAKNSSANRKLSKTQLSKMVQLGGFLGRLYGRLLKTGLALTKNVLNTLVPDVLYKVTHT